MIAGELESKVDRAWDTMWWGGISNPLSIIEQLTYLLFIKWQATEGMNSKFSSASCIWCE